MASFNLGGVLIIAAILALLVFLAYWIAAGRGGPGTPTREIHDSGADTTHGDSARGSGGGSGGRASGSWDDGPSGSGESSGDSSSSSDD